MAFNTINPKLLYSGRKKKTIFRIIFAKEIHHKKRNDINDFIDMKYHLIMDLTVDCESFRFFFAHSYLLIII